MGLCFWLFLRCVVLPIILSPVSAVASFSRPPFTFVSSKLLEPKRLKTGQAHPE